MRQAAALLLLLAPLAACAQSDFASTRAIPKDAPPLTYTIHIRDDAAYWDSTYYGGSFKTKALAIPDSNLTACTGPLPPPFAEALATEAAAELARLNDRDPYLDGWRESRFGVVDQRCFTADGVTVGLLRARTTEREYQALVIGVQRADEAPRLFAESNSLDEESHLIAYAEEDGVPVVYGRRNGNPNLNFGGRFRLAFQQDDRVLSFEYYEQTR